MNKDVMTTKEVSEMIGTEYEHRMYNNRLKESFITIKGVVAAFDPGVGFTGLATEEKFSNGMEIPKEHLDKNGNLCLHSIPRDRFKDDESFMFSVSEIASQIKTGVYESVPSFGNPVCNF